MCTDMCIGMCTGMRADMCIDMCTDKCIDMCKHICKPMCADICADMCTGMCIDTVSLPIGAGCLRSNRGMSIGAPVAGTNPSAPTEIAATDLEPADFGRLCSTRIGVPTRIGVRDRGGDGTRSVAAGLVGGVAEGSDGGGGVAGSQ